MAHPSLINRFADSALLAAEICVRQLYWRALRNSGGLKQIRAASKQPLQTLQADELRGYLREIGVVDGALVMAHTSVTHLRFQTPGDETQKGGFLATAKNLLDILLDSLGSNGTLIMPTNPQYQADDLLRNAAQRASSILDYDPARTPCVVGMANELFWRRKGSLRSQHPYNPLAATGPLAEKLLRENLNDREPLPHGVDSSYYRFCIENGLIVSVGVPLWHSMTIIHVAEEVREAEWPIPDFFERRHYRIRIGGQDEIRAVRQRKPIFGLLCNCNRKVRRDLLREDILHEGKVGDTIVDWARAKDVFEYMTAKKAGSHYPYYGVAFIGKKS
jgi:aminoglycoside N3'-acetyltransferase